MHSGPELENRIGRWRPDGTKDEQDALAGGVLPNLDC